MTQINYPDLTRTSPSGKLRLEIRSPDNDQQSARDDADNIARQIWGGFQQDFTFTVRRADTQAVIWQRTAESESPIDAPIDAWVGDDATVVIITRQPFSSDLVVLDAKGDICLNCDVASEILENNETELHWTSAGPHWNERGVGLFFEASSTRWWCFRTQLGRQVVVNLDKAALEKGAAPAQRLRDAQSEWALATVEKASMESRLFLRDTEFFDRQESDTDFFARVHYVDCVWAAILWCGVDGLSAAIPFLEKLERSTVRCGYGSGWPTPDCETTWFVPLTLAPIAKMAMRCLSHEPAGVAGYWLCGKSSPSFHSRLDVPECIADRTRRLNDLHTGMTKHEVAQCVGMPDVAWRHWDYDVLAFGEEACTMRLDWTWAADGAILETIERCPPAWLDPYSRSIHL